MTILKNILDPALVSAEPVGSSEYPVLTTARFKFRQFFMADIPSLVALASVHRIADTTVGMPYPYTNAFARHWISSHAPDWENRKGLHWAVIRLDDDKIAGYAGLHSMDAMRRQAELRFWVGCGVERHDYGVEWSRRVLDFAFDDLGMSRVHALQLARHPLAGHVLADIGMRRDGLVRKRILKDGLLEDLFCWVAMRPGESNNV